MNSTDRLSLPLLIAGQAQKELFHNEALQTLDTLVAAAVEDAPANDPPQSPSSLTTRYADSSRSASSRLPITC